MKPLSNNPKDWIKAFSYILVFLFGFCSFGYKESFYGLSLILLIACVFGYMVFDVINKIIHYFN